MKLIGITGKSGSGKSTLAQCLADKLQCITVDTDKVCHEALIDKEIIDKVCENFGFDILDLNTNNIDRKKLGNIVFNDSNKMKLLTNILWAYLEDVIDKIIDRNPTCLIIDGVAISQTKYWNQFDYKILVTADDLSRKENVIKRDNISEEYFESRDIASVDYSSLSFNYILKNNYTKQCIQDALIEIENDLK